MRCAGNLLFTYIFVPLSGRARVSMPNDASAHYSIPESHNCDRRTTHGSSLFLKRPSSLREMPLFMEMRFRMGWGGLLFLPGSLCEVSRLVELWPPTS